MVQEMYIDWYHFGKHLFHFRFDLRSSLTFEVCFNWTLQQSAMKRTPYCVLISYTWPSVDRCQDN